jgi:integrase
MRRTLVQPVCNRYANTWSRSAQILRIIMPVLPHNQRAIDALPQPAVGRQQYRSQSVTGLELEVMATGKRTWRVRYRIEHLGIRKFRAYKIGDARAVKLGQAIDKAREILAAVQVEGRDPQRERNGTDNTFDGLFTDWFENYAKIRRKSWAYDIALYDRHIKARIGATDPADIKRADFAAMLDRVAREVAPSQANKVQTLVSAVFGWAVNEGRLETHPGYRLPKRGIEKPRERVLSEAEIRKFWAGLKDGPIGETMVRVLKLALLTGQRRTEIAEASKGELNFVEATWTIAANRTKNGVTHALPLSPQALSIFKSAVEESHNAFVFPGRAAGQREAINPHAVSRAMARLMAVLGVEDAPTVHDLRRTVGTELARLGVNKDIRAKILNHVAGAKSVTDSVHNVFDYAVEKRTAMNRWDQRLNEILTAPDC